MSTSIPHEGHLHSPEQWEWDGQYHQIGPGLSRYGSVASCVVAEGINGPYVTLVTTSAR